MAQIELIKDYIAKEIKKFPHKEGLQETNVVNAIVRNVLKELETFINSLPAEQVGKDLEEEIKLYQLRNPVINHNERSLNDLVKRVGTYFANWQKEQLMKSAIDGCYISRNKYTKKNVLNGFDIKCDTIQKFKDGDKVKIIIIKENEK